MPAPVNLRVVNNISVCVMACKEWTLAGGEARCNYNHRTLQENAQAHACPHPAGPRFKGDAPAAEDLQQPEPPPITLAGQWEIAGPLLWAELHRWALTARLMPPDTMWLTNWLTRIMCGDCKRDALKWVADHPPDWGSNEGLFAWGVALHNYVNEKLRKPIMSVEDAAERWGGA